MLATARALSLAIDREVAAQQATVLALSGATSLGRRDWHAFYDRAMAAIGGDTHHRVVLYEPSG